MGGIAVLVVAAAVATVVVSPPAGAGPVANTGVLLLEAAGKPVSTSFAPEPGRTYTISVSGVYTYDGTTGLGLADCGHKDPEDQSGWINVANVLLDGKVARCSVLPFTPTHSYTWAQPGTGAPFTFEIFANTYTFDDTGCLLVTVSDGAVAPDVGIRDRAPALPPTCWRLTAGSS